MSAQPNQPFESFQKAVVLGSGSWGTSLATVLAHHFQQVVIVGRSPSTAQEITEAQTNSQYLPDVPLASNITGSTEFSEALSADLILFVLPTSVTRESAQALSQLALPEGIPLLSCSKGIERGSGIRMSQILQESFPNNPVAALSGPNHAEEVARQMATCAVVATPNKDLAQHLQQAFTAPYFRTYTSTDLAGVELGGALKNVFAIAAGILTGLNLGDNAAAALVTRGLAEMTRLGIALGGQAETFAGLSGIGDLMVTCYSPHSRNNRVGKALGQGETLEHATARLGMIAEGVPNTLSIYESARHCQIETPIIDAVYSILYQDKPATLAMQELLSREPKPE